ncbi:Cell differentiation RCD1-like protein [Nymphaea thermarum]|nr:Cell differentiation RCD1-like protein [Nymphaea thermarum]
MERLHIEPVLLQHIHSHKYRERVFIDEVSKKNVKGERLPALGSSLCHIERHQDVLAHCIVLESNEKKFQGNVENTISIPFLKRELFQDLAPMLWHSFGTIATLLQEIVSIYPVLSPPNLTPSASNRVCNALALLQNSPPSSKYEQENSRSAIMTP